MVKKFTEDFRVGCFNSYTILGDQIIALHSPMVDLILGSLVKVRTKKIPNSEGQEFEVIKIDLKDGIIVKDLRYENTYILNTNEVMAFKF
ncbi:hypothetical protein K9M42_03290 [Patescibacteria group bacterium]|nr:hypothetical protein [Patescibacteria group bacterium]